MSPFLKENVAQKSLSVDRVHANPAEEIDAALYGWKIEAVADAANALLSGATNMKTEIEKETIFWKDLVHLNSEGWTLTRPRGQPKGIAVKYGFSDGMECHLSQS